jgi:hypothetical protein
MTLRALHHTEWAELVEALFFFSLSAKERQGFDKLSPNGAGDMYRNTYGHP